MKLMIGASVLAGCAVLLAGCSSGSGGPATAPRSGESSSSAVTSTSASAAPSTSASSSTAITSPTPTTSAAAALPIGTKISAEPVEATVLAYNPTPPNPDGLTPLTPGYVWRAFQVRVCSVTGTVSISPAPWALQSQDGALNTSAEYGPAMPNYQGADGLQPGECIEGWLNFGLDPRKIPTVARYAPEPDDGSTPPGIFRWALSS